MMPHAAVVEETPRSSWRPWSWVPSLYFCEAVPYVVVMSVAALMYKRLGLSNDEVTFYTGWLYLPWVIKPLWSPLLERYRTKRLWILSLQFFMGAGLAAVALSVPTTHFVQLTLAAFWLLAFSSATHDIAADGFYLLALDPHAQSAFVGVRNTCYRLGNLAGQGGLVYLAGVLENSTGSIATAWSLVFLPVAAFFALAALYHLFVLPKPAEDRPSQDAPNAFVEWFEVFAAFFRKRGIVLSLAYLLLYRLGESQLVAVSKLFLIDPRAAGGLGMTTEQVGLAYGTYGVIALTIGGLAGGWAVAQRGLRAMLWPMLLCMHLPNVAYVLLAHYQPQSFTVACAGVVVEQLGYGFGFTAFMVYMMLVARGPHKTAHYSICTGIMALGMMLPGLRAGWFQELMGYTNFFVWVCIATLPSVFVVMRLKVDPEYGKRG